MGSGPIELEFRSRTDPQADMYMAGSFAVSPAIARRREPNRCSERSNQGLTQNVTVPVSGGLAVRTDGYFGVLTAYRFGDPLPIVESIAGASLGRW